MRWMGVREGGDARGGVDARMRLASFNSFHCNIAVWAFQDFLLRRSECCLSACKGMSTINSLVNDMSESMQLIASRRAMDDNDASANALMKKFASSMASKIAKLPVLSPGDAKHLSDAAKDCGQDRAGMQVIAAAVDAKLGVELDGEEDAKPANANSQLCIHPQSYVTDELMQSLRSRKTIDVKLTVGAEYLANQLGCCKPREQTYKHWLTLILLSHFEVWPRYQKVYELLLQLKAEVRSCRKKWASPPIAVYPRVPHELPDHIFRHIYGTEEPIVVDIERFAVTAKHHVPLRKNSKLITMEKKREAEAAAPPAPKTEAVEPPTKVKTEEPPEWARAVLAMAQVVMAGSSSPTAAAALQAGAAKGERAGPVKLEPAEEPPQGSTGVRPPRGLQPKGLLLRDDDEEVSQDLYEH